MKRVFIYGSCVTRDAVPWFQEFGFELGGYVARQSLISAFRSANVAEFSFNRISSNFQRRMAIGDVQGNLRTAIRKAAPDLIFWDLCDERLGVRSVPSGGMLTQSRDFISEKIHDGPFGRLHRFGEDQHFSLWRRGLEELLSALKRYGMIDRLYLNAVPWAEKDEFGRDYNGQAEAAAIFNSKAERYLDLAWNSGVNVSLVPQNEAISRTEGHKWGPAPFHYVDDVYMRMLKNLHAEVIKSC